MFHTTHSLKRPAIGIAVAASLLALSAPSAFGQTNRYDGHAAAAHGYRFITDTLAPGGHSTAVQGYRFTTDTLAPGGGSNGVSAQTARGFDWGDAGIGAAGTASLMLGLLGSARLLQHRRSTVAA